MNLNLGLGLLLALAAVPAFANVKFLAVGNPSAIRIQGEGKTISSEKTAWTKDGKFSGTFHVPLDSLDTGIAMRDKHMKEKYLETAKFPNADLELAPCGLKAAETICDGKLTLHGVTKPVAIMVKATPLDAQRMKVGAKFTVKLTDYGIAIPKFANITVAENVQIQVDSETAKP